MSQDEDVRVPLKRGRKPLADGEFTAAALDTRRRILEAGRRLVEEKATWPSPSAIHGFDPSLSVGNIGHHVDVVNEARRIWCAAHGPHRHWTDPLEVDEPADADTGLDAEPAGTGGGVDSPAGTGASIGDAAAAKATPGVVEELDLERLRTRRLERELKEEREEVARLRLVVANMKEINERLLTGLRKPLEIQPHDGGEAPV